MGGNLDTASKKTGGTGSRWQKLQANRRARKEIADEQGSTRGHSGVSSRRATLLDEQNGGEPEKPKSNSLKDRFYGAVSSAKESFQANSNFDFQGSGSSFGSSSEFGSS